MESGVIDVVNQKGVTSKGNTTEKSYVKEDR